jgi:hypothetical protein
MLSASRYLLGVAELGALIGFAWLGATALRRRLVPELSAAPAHLATTVLALALLLWTAQLLGTVGLFEPLSYLVGIGLMAAAAWAATSRAAAPAGGAVGLPTPEEALATGGGGGSPAATGPAGRPARGLDVAALAALLIGLLLVIDFSDGVRLRLDTGMTGFDSTWYHAPFAAGFFQTGDTWSLHFIAPQFFAWFYPASGEIFHAIGMNAFDRDVLSPLLNLGWLIGCLVAAWCVGVAYSRGAAALSTVLTAVALNAPFLADQAGEARNDLVGTFFLLAAVAIAVNAWRERQENDRGLATGALLMASLSAGLAAGAKLNFLLPSAILVIGFAAIAPSGRRWRSFAIGALAALSGGGYWYLRNLIHTGNPLPWFDSLGPVSLPGPDQALGGREEHSVFGYLTDGSVWSDWFLPGLHQGLGGIWPLIVGLAAAGLVLNLSRGAGPILRVSALVGLAAAAAWLIAPTSASGPEGTPQGFESGLRYLAPALVLGMALLPVSPRLRARLNRLGNTSPRKPSLRDGFGGLVDRLWPGWVLLGLLALVVAIGYPAQREYLRDRYVNPTFTTPGLNAAFEWARSIEGARIGTTSTRQYPLFGTDLSNDVRFIGEERPHGGFVAPSGCRPWRRALNEGGYDYVVASRDRIEPNKPPYPASAGWTAGPRAEVVLRKPPTVVFQLKGPLDPSACR